jgi:hypothetical protein
VEEVNPDLLTACGIDDLVDLSRRCAASRASLELPATRWSPKCLAIAIKLAVVSRGWPAPDVVPALLAIAADPETRSPARLAEAGPWWDQPIPSSASDERAVAAASPDPQGSDVAAETSTSGGNTMMGDGMMGGMGAWMLL